MSRKPSRQTFRGMASSLAKTGRRLYARSWALGTSGNFSAVVSRRPVRLAITASGVSKRKLGPTDILQCDGRGSVVGRQTGQPSAETSLHLEIVRRCRAGAVLHTHSVWSTMLSDRHAAEGGVGIEGYEMLKGLKGIATHEHREWIPILENDQDIDGLGGRAAGHQQPERALADDRQGDSGSLHCSRLDARPKKCNFAGGGKCLIQFAKWHKMRAA